MEPDDEIKASFVIYTTFEKDEGFVLPKNVMGEALHGRFNENGHVVAFVTEKDQTLAFVTRNGVRVKVKVNVGLEEESSNNALPEEDVEFIHA